MFKEMPKFKHYEVCVYLRKSRSDDPLLSLEEVLSNHEEIIDKWCIDNLGAKVPEQNKYREIVSGEYLIDRPEIQKLLRQIESPAYKAIAVVEPQRLSRGDLEDIGRLMKILKHTRTYIITPMKTYDLNDDFDWDAFERELKRGNDYLEYQKKILNRGKLLSVSHGNYIGSVPPYGYDKIYIMDGKKKFPSLRINEEQAEVVRMIFDMYVNQNMGVVKICHTLDAIGIRPIKGEYWNRATVKEILANVHYIGKVKWNHRKTVKVVENGEILSTRPKQEKENFMIFDGKHEPIVSDEIFEKAVKKRGLNPRNKEMYPLQNPLAGIVYCECGHAMVRRNMSTRNGIAQPVRLLCSNQVNCHNSSCRFDDMIEKVYDILKESIKDFEVELKSQDKDILEQHYRRIESIKRKIHTLQDKELALWESQTNPDENLRMPQHIFKALVSKNKEELDSTKKLLQAAYDSTPTLSNYENAIGRFQQALDALKREDIDARTKNFFLKSCISRIEYKRAPVERFRNGWTDTEIELKVTLKI